MRLSINCKDCEPAFAAFAIFETATPTMMQKTATHVHKMINVGLVVFSLNASAVEDFHGS